MQELRIAIWVSLALLWGCDGEDAASRAHTDGEAANPTADSGSQSGAERDADPDQLQGDAAASGYDAGPGSGGPRDGGAEAGPRDTSSAAGPRDGGASSSDAAPAVDASLDADRDAGPLTINHFPIADHCAPGQYEPLSNAICVDLDGGSAGVVSSGVQGPPSIFLSVRWHRLPTAMTAHQPYAISVEVDRFSPPSDVQLEIWGAMSPCGTGGEQAERLGTALTNRGTGVYCLDLRPTKPYTHVMIAYRTLSEGNGSGSHGQTYCPMVMCPVR
jgi:hypothetical protein